MDRNIRRIRPLIPQIPRKKRVAAYARVSTGKDAMLHSLSAQVSYYNGYIQKNPRWEFGGVYADEACTGTKDGRAEFQRLLADCRAGKIDMVITKSISRFARNTVTMLEVIRELKFLNVDVFFEKENIHSISGDGELMLTILSSFAQEESLSVSENCKWRIRKRFENGELCGFNFMFGYQIKKGRIEINPVQAEIVRNIFDDYIKGVGCKHIAQKLRKSGVESYKGGSWTAKRIVDILKNEKYTGNALLQKEYVKDHLSKKQVRNDGVLPKYYAEKTHKPIIDSDTFQKAQLLLEENRIKSNIAKKPPKPYPFSGKIVCGNCGKNYKRITVHGHVAWNCSSYLYNGKDSCYAKKIPEETLISLITEILGISRFDAVFFEKKIQQIIVPEFNALIFVFHDGRQIKRTWQNRSRTESWDDIARQQAREWAFIRWREGK